MTSTRNAQLSKLQTALETAVHHAETEYKDAPRRLENMRYFAGRDTQVLNRLPLVQDVARKEEALARRLRETLNAIETLREAYSNY